MFKKIIVLASAFWLASCVSLLNIAPDPKLTDFDLKDDEALILVGVPAGRPLGLMLGENKNGTFSRNYVNTTVIVGSGIDRYNNAVKGYLFRKVKLSQTEVGMAVAHIGPFAANCAHKTAYADLVPQKINYFGDIDFFVTRSGPGKPFVGHPSVIDKTAAAEKYIGESFPLAKVELHRAVVQWITPAESAEGYRCAP